MRDRVRTSKGALQLQGRLVWNEPGQLHPFDMNEDTREGFGSLAREAGIVMEVLDDCASLLRTLDLAATGRETINSREVTAVLRYVLGNLDGGCEPRTFALRMKDLFEECKVLPPVQMNGKTRKKLRVVAGTRKANPTVQQVSA